MAGELEKLCKMLDDGDAELQIAVARVLRELKSKDAVAKKALAGALKSGNDSVRLYALEALAEVDPADALPRAVPLLAAAEPLRGRATALLVGAGKAAVKPLQDALDAKDAQVRKGILEILGRIPGVDTTDTLFAGLLDPELDVVRKAAAAYRARIETMSEAERGKALKRILEFMASPKVQKIKTPLASCLLIVGSFRDASTTKSILPYLDKKMPPAVRNHALLALGSLTLEGKDASAAVGKLLPLLGEADFNEIVKPALDVLHKLPTRKEDADRLLKLQKTGGPAVKAWATRALGSTGSSGAADALIEALWGDDPRLSETAGQSLRSNPDYIPALAKALDQQEDVGKAWKVVHALTAFKNVLEKPLVKKFLAKALGMLDKKESGFQSYFEIARIAAPELAKSETLDKGLELLKKGKFEDAERTLRLLSRDDLAAPESDLALATAKLRQQRLDVTGASRDQGEGVQLFLKLSRKEGFLKLLEKNAGLVTAEGLLYVGFALAERQGTDRDAGAAVLKLVAKKFGAKEEGKVAKQKLKTQGLG